MDYSHFVAVRSLPKTGWSRIDVASLWPGELYPLIDRNRGLQRELEIVVNAWIVIEIAPALVRSGRRFPKRWRWRDRRAEAPYFMTVGDGAVCSVDDAIREAAERGEPDAVRYDALMARLFDDDAPRPRKAETRVLHAEMDAIWEKYSPQRERDVRWVRPDGSCHAYAPFELLLARAWDGASEWRIASSNWHSTIVDVAGMRIFDLVLLPGPDEPDNEPVNFVRGVGATARTVRKCDRANERHRLEWEAKRMATS